MVKVSSRSQGQRSRSQMKGLVTRNLHVKYENPTTYGSRDRAKVKVFVTDRRTDGQTNEIQCPLAFAKARDNYVISAGKTAS